jgi:hypothetical protein
VHHGLVVGYHGCDREVVQRVLMRGEMLRASRNTWDWLGTGIYFWENSHRRALEFAQEQKERGKVEQPAVLGAYISIGRCFDLTDTETTALLAGFYENYRLAREDAGLPLHTNRPGRGSSHDLLLRDLDCAVLNLGLANLDATEGGGSLFYQTGRGVFVEGTEAYPGAAIRTKTHVQIAVRDPSCIVGFFLPAGYRDDEEAL